MYLDGQLFTIRSNSIHEKCSYHILHLSLQFETPAKRKRAQTQAYLQIVKVDLTYRARVSGNQSYLVCLVCYID